MDEHILSQKLDVQLDRDMNKHRPLDVVELLELSVHGVLDAWGCVFGTLPLSAKQAF